MKKENRVRNTAVPDITGSEKAIQREFPDIYASGMGSVNYNMAVTGTAGAGKTGQMESFIRRALDAGKTVTRGGHGKTKWILTVTTPLTQDVRPESAEAAWKNSALRITLRHRQ